MKKSRWPMILALFTTMLIVGACMGLRSTTSTDASYVLIRQMPGGLYAEEDEHKAILINQPMEIQDLYFRSNGIFNNHACWFHWQIEFWSAPHRLDDLFVINQECTSISLRLRAYLLKARNSPTHTIYNIVLPVSVSPDEVVNEIQELDFYPFIFSGSFPNNPVITIAKEVELETELRQEVLDYGGKFMSPIISTIKDEFEVVYQSPYGCSPG